MVTTGGTDAIVLESNSPWANGGTADHIDVDSVERILHWATRTSKSKRAGTGI